MKNITYSGVLKTARNVEAVHTHTHTHTHTGSLSVRRKTNKNITIFLLFIIFIILNTGKSKAVLQANGNTSATYDFNNWMLNVRKMEELGGAMGLTEILNSDLTSSSNSNNIDVHMQKNTEYGALVILSTSNYGKPNKVEDGQTTTGNATGVVIKLNNEWVAAGTSSTSATNFKTAVQRYKNIYTTTAVGKSGDAMLETKGWHESTTYTWFDNNVSSALIRSISGSLFSYNGKNISNSHGGYTGAAYRTRAVVVSGQGL